MTEGHSAGAARAARDARAARLAARSLDEPVRFAILGPGLVGAVHAAALARIPDARLEAVAGSSAASPRAVRLAAEHGARPVAGIGAVLDDPAVDAVIVCTPHPLHAEQAIAAARAGLHVIVEKPMALEPADCTAMIEAAEGAGVMLSVISQRRWYPAVRRVKAAIDDGRIGAPALATIEVLGWRGPEYYEMDAWRGTVAGEGGGVLVNQAVHQLDLACWLLGPVVEVDGWIANVNHPEIEVEDTAVAIVRFARGTIATIVASNAQRPGLHARIHVHGASGASVGVETDRGSSFVAGVSVPSEPRNDLWTIPGEETAPERWAVEDRTALAGADLATRFHELQLRDIVAAIREGRPPAVGGEDGRIAVELMAAIAAAGRNGGRIRIDAAAARVAR
jgi:UDP-N-acetyl-2-amino-2-deoxyglucuronate dehydrogenase